LTRAATQLAKDVSAGRNSDTVVGSVAMAEEMTFNLVINIVARRCGTTTGIFTT